jgi:hypothetical protein
MAEPFTRDLSGLTREQYLEMKRVIREEVKQYGREIDWDREQAEFEQEVRRALAFVPKHMKLLVWVLEFVGMRRGVQEALFNKLPKELKDRLELRHVRGGVEDVEGK